MAINQHCPHDSHVVIKSEKAWDMPYADQNIPLRDEHATRPHVKCFYVFNMQNTLFWDITHIMKFIILEYTTK